ncbi:MAG TPA: type IV secretion system DNA-binding domain-containing protein [Candidatus Saccharimonadales bacterium]|nr:type IV secretion system DNA-binding domain-containing protein [Candidatus Saccharimonadales bacterium]
MTHKKLDWFQLQFPQGVETDHLLAGLSSFSGVPFRARIVLDLTATAEGIKHLLGVTPKDTGTVTAALRAAMPSLRLAHVEAPPRPPRRWLWQTAPRVASLRSEEPIAIAAALLSSLFPLDGDEAVRLTWTLRSWPRPPLPVGRYDAQDGRERVVRAKLSLPGLAAYGELSTVAKTPARRAELTQRTASALWSLSTPFGRLAVDPYWLGQVARLLGLRGRYLSAPELAAVIGWPVGSPDLPGLELGAAKRLVPAASLPEDGRVLGVSDFAGITRPVAISATASTRGLYVLGPTGTGKTNLLKNLIRDDLEQGRGLVVVETNGDLIQELCDVIPPERVNDVVLLDPTDRDSAVGFNPLASGSEPSLIADQLSELFQRLWEAFWGPRTAQLTHMGLLTLARRPGSTLLDLPRLYLDSAFREKVLADLDDPLGLGPDWQWFENLPTREQANVVAPLLNKVRAFTARPAIRAIVGQPKPRLTMHQIIEQKKVLLVHLPKGLIGSETAQLLGCLVLTAVWQAAAERAALPPSQRHPVSLYVDEVQDFASAPVPWDEMFAQGRKYGLALTAAHQNLEQLPKELREVVLANARSKAVFALSATDARTMERLFEPALTAADLQALDAYSVAALVALDNGSAARPVTLTTPPPVKSLGSRAQVRATSHQHYARPRAEIEAELRRGVTPRRPKTPVGRKPRRAS